MHVIMAPSNLGFRPLRPNHEPGTWRAPEALLEAGLLKAIGVPPATSLPRPIYSPEPQAGTRIRNGRTMRDFNLMLAETVRDVRRRGEFALVIGGDCSILMGALAGAQEEGPIALIHIDGHSDFRHAGNYDFKRNLGAAAGMDLALVTGRGEPLGTEWPGIKGSLVADTDVIQLGERESRDPDFAWPDVRHTAIDTIDVFEATAIGAEGVAARIATMLAAKPDQGFWIHLDVDVLDESIMPAVDCPGSPGIPPEDLVAILRPLVANERCRGMTVTVFDPDLDPDGKYAATIVSLMADLAFPAPAPVDPIA
ncbi:MULTISPECIES: arginase family protein [unclassified Sphingomonas]|jgi:arginase|uniref:arginase family protein n=1 Tax=unclassified Sphingomonas TaxID=196159 RepID=UPI0025EEFC5F|nr:MULTISPECIES: arginase family protein [unclassified Sphingomonas]